MKALFLLISMGILITCGGETTVVEKEVPVAGSDPIIVNPPPSGGTKLSYAQMKPKLDKYCRACHATAKFMLTEAGLRSESESVRRELVTRNMPRGSSIPEGELTLMVNYF